MAKRIRRARLKRETPMGKTAARAGVTRNAWLRYELGHGSIPAELLPKIADAIEVPIDHILFGVKKAA